MHFPAHLAAHLALQTGNERAQGFQTHALESDGTLKLGMPGMVGETLHRQLPAQTLGFRLPNQYGAFWP